MHFSKKSDSQKMSSAFLERLKMASYCSMTSLERISSKPFRRKMCNSESVPEVFPRSEKPRHVENDRNGFIGSGDSNDLTQCYSVTTGKVSTLLKAPSCSSLSSIEVAEINTSNKLMSRNSMKGDSSIGFAQLSSHQTNGYAISKGQSEDVTYLTNTSSLPPMHRRQTERYIGPNIKSSLIRTSKVIRTLQHSVCSHGIDR